MAITTITIKIATIQDPVSLAAFDMLSPSAQARDRHDNHAIPT